MKLKELRCINDHINLEEYIAHREKVKKNMECPDWLGDFRKEDLKKMLGNGSKIWMYYKEDEFICSMMLIPATEKSVKKFELDLDYKVVADYGPMFVNYKYIGNKLQFQMLEELDEYCRNHHYQYAVSTIHPDNIYSINNLVKDEFKMIGSKELKRGPRNVYLKKL